MSVRATERLVGDTVIVPGLPNSPLMIVQTVEEETKMVNVIWFSDGHECQEGVFPAKALDRYEPLDRLVPPKAAAAKKSGPGQRGRKAAR